MSIGIQCKIDGSWRQVFHSNLIDQDLSTLGKLLTDDQDDTGHVFIWIIVGG